MSRLVLLTCLTLVACEWVEISQHHYRRPVHLTQTDHTEYTNQSLTHDWSKPSISDPFKTPYEDNFKKFEDFKKNEAKRPADFVTGKIERVPNVGNVKRVQITNTPVKSPSMNVKKVWKRPADDRNQADDEINLKSDIFKETYEELAITPVNDNRYKVKPFDTSTKSNNRFKDFIENVLPTKSTTTPLNTQKINIDKRITNSTSSQQNQAMNTVKDEPKRTDLKGSVVKEVLNKDEPQFVTKNDKVNIAEVNNDGIRHPTQQHNINAITNEQSTNSNVNMENGHNLNESKKPSKENVTKDKVKSNEFKVNTMENILKFMKVVTETISSNSRRGVGGKVKYLNELKDVMLANIKDRIDATWPDDETNGRRQSRSATSRGHVEFPSSESALMTISFLTFAVFLIKLVLQVIQTYKNKAMIMAPVMVATAGRTLARRQRKN